MTKLLSANFFRLKKNKCFWVCMIFMLAAGVFFPVMRYVDMQKSGTVNTLDNGFFACALFIGVLASVFCSLFIGTEYSDGTIRNKVVVGQKRSAIYLSNLITCAAAGVAMCLAFFLPYLGLGMPLLGFFTADVKVILLFTLAVFALCISFNAIFTMNAMLNQNKAVVAVTCILSAFVLLGAGAYINARLDEPKTYPSYNISGEETASTVIENPDYLEGTERDVYQFLYDFFPGGQAVQCSTMEAVHPPMLPVYSAVIVVLTTGLGLFFFRRKDLK